MRYAKAGNGPYLTNGRVRERVGRTVPDASGRGGPVVAGCGRRGPVAASRGRRGPVAAIGPGDPVVVAAAPVIARCL